MKHHRPLTGGSVDTYGTDEWKLACKRFGYSYTGSLRGSYPYVEAFNAAGELVGKALSAGHGAVSGFVSPSAAAFETDWLDEIVRLKEQLVLDVERWKASTPAETGLGTMHDEIVQRHVDNLPASLARLDASLRARTDPEAFIRELEAA